MLDIDNKRRFRTYSRRIVNMASGGLRHPCVFMHVPKCGGTSVSEALYATVPMSRRVGVIDAISTRRATTLMHADTTEPFLYHDDLPTGVEVYKLREQILLTHMAWNTELIHGHIIFSKKAYKHFGDHYRFITLLREPTARVLSNFLGSVRGGMIKDDLDAYLDSEIFRTQGLSMLRYFSGIHAVAPENEVAALEQAKSNMALFSIIGFLDNLDDFSDQYRAMFGRCPRIFHYNLSESKHPVLNAAQQAKIESVMRSEFELWQHALTTYKR